MVKDALGDRTECIDSGDTARSDYWMLTNDEQLAIIQLLCLAEDVIWHGHHSYVVQQTCYIQRVKLFLR